MDIYFLGLTSVRLRGKKTTLVVDPFDKETTGIAFEQTQADAVLQTEESPKASLTKVRDYRVVINGPGEYEVGGASILGIPIGNVTTYYIKMDGIALLHLGKCERPLTDAEIERYPSIDVVFAPVNRTSANFIAKLEPKIVVPINFTQKSNDAVVSFLSELGKGGIKPQPKLSISKEKLPAEVEAVWLH